MTHSPVHTADEVELLIESLDERGVGHAALANERREFLVEDALPGEQVRALVTFAGKQRIYARSLELLGEASTDRRAERPCPRWTARSPCQLMHLERDAQLEHKRGRVQRALERTLGAEQVPEIPQTVGAGDELGWRGRVSFVICRGREGITLGAFRRGSHEVQPMLDCALPAPALGRTARVLEAVLREHLPRIGSREREVPDRGCGAPLERGAIQAGLGRPKARGIVEPGRGLRYAVLRCTMLASTPQISVCLLGSELEEVHLRPIVRALRAQVPEVCAVFFGEAGAGDQLFGEAELHPLEVSAPLVEEHGGLKLAIAPKAFFQLNPRAALAIQQAAVNEVVQAQKDLSGPVVELFSGVGALSLMLASRGLHVQAFENAQVAVEDARANASRNQLDELTEFTACDARDGLESLTTAPEQLLLNPPRRGLGSGVLEALVKITPSRLIYISCNPTTLAEDAKALLALGYRLLSVAPYDLFPHSEHVEVLAVFQR